MAKTTHIGGILEGKRAYRSEAKEGVNKGVITDRLSVTIRCDDNHDAHKEKTSLFTFQITKDDVNYETLMALEKGMNVYMCVQATERNGFTNVVVDEVEITAEPDYCYPDVENLDAPTIIPAAIGDVAVLPGIDEDDDEEETQATA